MCPINRIGILLVAAMALSLPARGQQQPSVPAGGPFTKVPILDAPFSADAITRIREILPDGNVREHTMTAHYYRDSRGRVRAELDTPWGQYIRLDLRLGPWPGMRDVQYTDGSWGPGGVFELDPAAKTYRFVHPALTWLFNGEGRVMLPIGKERFRYSPAVEGASDADRLRAVHAEVSPDLGIVISSHRADDMGFVDYKVTNIRRQEPSADFFTVPSDYRWVNGTKDDLPTEIRPWRDRSR